MKTKSELTDFYYKSLFPILEKLDGDRRQLRFKIILYLSSFTFIYIFSILLIINNIGPDFDVIIFGGFGYFAIISFIYKFLIKDYTAEFKDKIIKPLVGAIDSNLLYTSNSYVSEAIFNKSDLFSTSDRLSGNDHVKGKINDIKIEFSDIHAEKKHKDSKGRTTWSTIFRGLFIVAEFNKHFAGKTLVLPDTAQSTFGDLIGGWLQANNFSQDELVRMDNTKFEKAFVVYSTNQIEARYILSHTIMEKLLTFKKKSQQDIYISFVGEDIHMAIYYNKDMFEPSVFKSLLEYKVAMEYVDTLHLALGIVEELKLNQKLWSKR